MLPAPALSNEAFSSLGFAPRPERPFTYALIRTGPDLDPDEVEEPHAMTTEVLVMWGETVIHVAHLESQRDFYLGESHAGGSSDVLIPKRVLGAERLPLVRVRETGSELVIPEAAHGTIGVPGQPLLDVSELRERRRAENSIATELALPLSHGLRARLHFGDFRVQVAHLPRGKASPRGLLGGFDSAVASYFGLSLLVHAAALGIAAFLMPTLGEADSADLDRERALLMQAYLDASAERERQTQQTDPANAEPARDSSGSGERATSAEGALGNPLERATNRRWASRGPLDNPDPHLARERELRDAASFGLIGLLNGGLAGDRNAPTALFGRDAALGADNASAMGALFGAEIGEAFGAGGLSLLGTEQGGGGHGEGIGVGDIGGLGHGLGHGPGQGIGHSFAPSGPGHVARAPRAIRSGQLDVSGHLPPEVIQRIVRQNFGRFRFCYEQGLSRNPNLEGRVGVRFVIGRDGAVGSVVNGASDLPDAAVVSCVLSSFYGLSFPAPETGVVRVSYPIAFAPG